MYCALLVYMMCILHFLGCMAALGLALPNETTRPIANVKPPFPVGNASTYSIITRTSTGMVVNTLTALASTTTYQNASKVATLCASSDHACMSRCTSVANECQDNLSLWSGSRKVWQSSMASKLNGGVIPMTPSYYTRTVNASTVWSYETSWTAQRLTTSDWSYVLSTTTMSVDGTPTTRTDYTQSVWSVFYTSSTPVAAATSLVTTIPQSEITFTYAEISYYDGYTVPEPSCSPTSWLQCKYRGERKKCTISGGTVELLYFPVPRTSATAALNITATITSTNTALETAVYQSVTLTSPSVYISFQTAYAENECGSQVGSRYPGAILPLPLTDLSSVYGGYGTLYTSDNADPFATQKPYLAAGQFNLADLNWPPPMSAYTNQLQFQLGMEVFSIMTKPYNPHLAVPSQIRNLDPAWKSCELDWQGLYDPPIALTPASAVAQPTVPTSAEVEITGAAPSPTMMSLAHQTTVADFTIPAQSGTSSSGTSGLQGSSTIPRPSQTAQHSDLAGDDPPSRTSTNYARSASHTPALGSLIASPWQETSTPVLTSTRKPASFEASAPEPPSPTFDAASPAPISSAAVQPAWGSLAPLPVIVPAPAPSASDRGGAGTDPLVATGDTALGSGRSPSKSGTSASHVFGQSDVVPDTTAAHHSFASLMFTFDPSTTVAPAAPSLATAIPRVVFTFGTHTYTAAQTKSGEAFIGSLTFSAGGNALSLTDGSVSLARDGSLIMINGVPTATSHVSHPENVITAKAAAITLQSTTLTAVHPAGAGNGVVSVDGTTLSPGGAALTVSEGQRLSAGLQGVVVLGTDGAQSTAHLGKTTWTRTLSSGRTSSPTRSPVSTSAVVAMLSSSDVLQSTVTSGAVRDALDWAAGMLTCAVILALCYCC